MKQLSILLFAIAAASAMAAKEQDNFVRFEGASNVFMLVEILHNNTFQIEP